MATDWEKLQDKVRDWQRENFPFVLPEHKLKKAAEELVELSVVEGAFAAMSAHLPQNAKELQGFYTSVEREVGDVIISLLGYCALRGWDLERIVFRRWKEIEKRKYRVGKVVRQVPCPYCGAPQSTPTDLWHHVEAHHQDVAEKIVPLAKPTPPKDPPPPLPEQPKSEGPTYSIGEWPEEVAQPPKGKAP